MIMTANDPDNVLLDDPVLQLIVSGRATNLDEAEELYLDESLPEFFRLCGSSMSNAELEQHPLTRLLLVHGMDGLEDSLL